MSSLLQNRLKTCLYGYNLKKITGCNAEKNIWILGNKVNSLWYYVTRNLQFYACQLIKLR